MLVCYGKTPHNCGRHLEDALRRVGFTVELYTEAIDFQDVEWDGCIGVLFIEVPSRPDVAVQNIEAVRVPKLFWIHHGVHRWEKNRELCRMYQPDLVLMSHSLHLARNLNIPVRFFPFAMAVDFFNSARPLAKRSVDVSFVGSQSWHVYPGRRKRISLIKQEFEEHCRLSMDSTVYLEELAQLYGDSKIIFNRSADRYQAVNMRLFEGMGCGALVLTDCVLEQPQLFKDRVHYVVFHDDQDLLNKARYYLDHLDEAQAIATRGREYLLAKHTYEHRAGEVCRILDELWKKKKRERKSNVEIKAYNIIKRYLGFKK